MEFSLVRKNKEIIGWALFAKVFSFVLLYHSTVSAVVKVKTNEEIKSYLEQVFQNRNCAILKGDGELIKPFFDMNMKFGRWAYEHEIKKMKYIYNWEQKQGIEFIDIIPTLVIGRIKMDGETAITNLLCSTEYKYIYKDAPEEINTFCIGTHHVLQIIKRNEAFIIKNEWYKDPFEDSLDLNKLKVEDIKNLILSKGKKEPVNQDSKRMKVVKYLNEYCGAASEEKYGYSYNKKYRNYNSTGGDCANFASQSLFEGGKFKKNTTWNFDQAGSTTAWVSATVTMKAFTKFPINSFLGILLPMKKMERSLISP
jgi:hypothetical protein